MPVPAVPASAPSASMGMVSLTEPTGIQIGVTITAAILSGLVALALSTWHMRRFEARKIKFDTLKKFAAHRNHLNGDEFSQAINEIFIVFNSSKPVMSALAAFHKGAVNGSAENDQLILLFKAMCNDLDVDFSQFNDSFFFTPFNVKQ